MFTKLGAYLNLLRKGQEVADPEKWKNRQITGTILGAAIIAAIKVAEIHGYQVPITSADADTIGGAIIVIVNLVLTATTSKRAALLPGQPGGVGQSEAVEAAPTTVQSEIPAQVVEPVVQPKAQADKKDYDDKSIYIG